MVEAMVLLDLRLTESWIVYFYNLCVDLRCLHYQGASARICHSLSDRQGSDIAQTSLIRRIKGSQLNAQRCSRPSTVHLNEAVQQISAQRVARSIDAQEEQRMAKVASYLLFRCGGGPRGWPHLFTMLWHILVIITRWEYPQTLLNV